MASHIYVFDLDGVVTNPENNAVNNGVLAHIADDLKHNFVVAFNTGRPYAWVEEMVLAHLRRSVLRSELNNLLVVAEMGGVVCTFQDGQPQLAVDPNITLPKDFQNAVTKLLDQELPTGGQYHDYAWWDGDRETMGSLIKLAAVPLIEFNRIRPLFTADVQALMHEYHLDDFIIGQTAIATDIQHKSAGKHKGAQKIMEWLADRNITPDIFYTFGDSLSDKAMAEEFTRASVNTTFVFVGDPSLQHSTVVTGGRNDNDTADFLAQHG